MTSYNITYFSQQMKILKARTIIGNITLYTLELLIIPCLAQVALSTFATVT